MLDHIREGTVKDKQIQKLYQRIQKEDWEKYRKDEYINPYNSIKEELYVADGLIFRLNQNDYTNETATHSDKSSS